MGMIPAEAVEAAARALFEKELGRPMEVSDEPLYSEDIQACREDARAALEAAAPYMLAAVWEQGWDSFASFDSRPGGPYPTNPYMLNNEGEK
jgi:hypothetical protein